MDFVNEHNSYRKDNIHVFETKTQERNKDFLKEKLRFLTPIRLPGSRKDDDIL
jgi:hypothetical protein